MTQEIPRRLRQRVERGRHPVVAPAPRSDSAEISESDADGVSQSIRSAAAWAWRILVIVAALAVIVYILGTFSSIVIPLLVALVLSVALFPIFSVLVKKARFPRVAAAITTVLLFVAIIVGLIALAGRGIYAQFWDLWARALDGMDKLLSWAAEGPLHLETDQVMAWFDELLKSASNYSGILASGALSVTSSIGSVLAGFVIVLFLLIFLLKDGRLIWVWCVRIMPKHWREPVHEASIRGFVTMQGYVKSTILVAAIDATGIGLGAALLGVPLALPLAILVFIGSFIPFVGALLTGSIAVLVALVDKGFGTAFVMLLIVLLVQQIEGNVLQPLIMGHNVSLHPVVVVLAVTGGAFIAGITGAIFAVPLIAFINTVTLYLKGYDKYPEIATKEDRPGGPPGSLDAMIRASYGFEEGADLARESADEESAVEK
ncbi:MAG: AI-2E family transporter [Ruaniaceae bacterium]|nr:AI-2E family transporter [Ruaniaceae bacterium]